MNQNLDGSTESAAPSQKAERQEGMGGLAKGLAIIESFSRSRPRLTLTEAAVASNTTPAAARRCLLTLEQLGYVTHDARYFEPTPRLARLSGAYLDANPIPSLGQPRLVLARDELGESISLAVLDQDRVTMVARAETERIVSAGVRLGSTLPAAASATGRVLLSALTDDELDTRLRSADLTRTTDKTLVTVAEVRERVKRVRIDGYAFTDEELEYGVRTIAVPVVDSEGVTRAAMSASAFAARTSMEQMRSQFVSVLTREAAKLGKML